MAFFELSFMGKSKKVNPVYWEVTLHIKFVRFDFENTLPEDTTCSTYHTWKEIMKQKNPSNDSIFSHLVSPIIEDNDGTYEFKTRYLELIKELISSKLLYRYVGFDEDGNIKIVFVIEPLHKSIVEYQMELDRKQPTILCEGGILNIPSSYSDDIDLGDLQYTTSIREIVEFNNNDFVVSYCDSSVQGREKYFRILLNQ